ncbi:MAG: hypothetical protein ACK528_14980 [Alphaproteobacteria bacterium]
MSPLAEELSKPQYASLSDQQAADAINAKTVVVRRPAELWRVKQLLIEQGIWGSLKVAVRKSDTPDAVYGLCVSVIDWIDDPSGKVQTVDVDLPSVQAMLAGLIQIGIGTQANVTALLALGNTNIRWVDSVGLGTVGDGSVKSAREEIGVTI